MNISRSFLSESVGNQGILKSIAGKIILSSAWAFQNSFSSYRRGNDWFTVPVGYKFVGEGVLAKVVNKTTTPTTLIASILAGDTGVSNSSIGAPPANATGTLFEFLFDVQGNGLAIPNIVQYHPANEFEISAGKIPCTLFQNLTTNDFTAQLWLIGRLVAV